MLIFKTEFSLNGETDSVATEYTVLNMNIYEKVHKLLNGLIVLLTFYNVAVLFVILVKVTEVTSNL